MASWVGQTAGGDASVWRHRTSSGNKPSGSSDFFSLIGRRTGGRAFVSGTAIVPVGVWAQAATVITGVKLSSAASPNETTPQELGLAGWTPQDLVVEPGVT